MITALAASPGNQSHWTVVPVQRRQSPNLSTGQLQSFCSPYRLEFTVRYSLNVLQAIQFSHRHCHPGQLSHDRSPEPEKRAE